VFINLICSISLLVDMMVVDCTSVCGNCPLGFAFSFVLVVVVVVVGVEVCGAVH